MKPVYERENLTITEFNEEDVITTSGIGDHLKWARDNKFGSFTSFDQDGGFGAWW